jgi:AcrR family transcriptional regulator
MQENKNNTAYKLSLRDKILDTAMIMFTTKGIRAVKMDDIANSLQISKRTLYELYSDMEHLLLEGLKKHINLRSAEMHRMAVEKDNVMDIILEVFLRKVDEF